MIKYLLLLALPFSLYAAKILSYNIYERTDRADVMITFDTPYNGTIKQSLSKSSIVIKLEDASIESFKKKKVSSNYLHSLSITPMKEQVQIIASVSPSVKLIASKTSDSYGLRLRFVNSAYVKTNPVMPIKQSTSNLSALPTKKSSEMSRSYYIVVGVLILGIIILLVLKNKMQVPKETKVQDSWLFKSSSKVKNKKIEESLSVNKQTAESVSIRFQKSIDEKSSVVMLDFGVQSYLVLMGNNNILLDKFSDDKPTNQEEFESVLQSRHQELEEFLGNDPLPTYKEPLQAYKERAASLIYSDEA